MLKRKPRKVNYAKKGVCTLYRAYLEAQVEEHGKARVALSWFEPGLTFKQWSRGLPPWMPV